MGWGTGFSTWGSGWRQTLTTNTIVPSTADTEDLGSTSKEWDELFIGDDGGVYFGIDQDVRQRWSSPDFLTTFASLGAVDAAGGSWKLTAQGGGTGGTGNHAGGDIVLTPGAKAGTAADGKFVVRQPGGTPGTDELTLRHDGTNAKINAASGYIGLSFAGSEEYVFSSMVFYPPDVNARTFGATNKEWRSGFFGEDTTTGSISDSGLYLGLAQEARLRYNKDATNYPANTLILGLEASGTAAKDSLAFSSATISGFSNVTTDLPGEDTFLATQTAGTHSSANPRGGNCSIELGAGTGTGADGILYVKSGASVLIEAGDSKIGFFAQTAAAQPTGVAVSAAGIHAALVTLGLITT